MTLEQFHVAIDRSSGDGCWPWTKAVMGSGYGELNLDKRVRYAHVVALEVELGRPLAAGEWACHGCDNPRCCRVGLGHIYLGDAQSNTADMVRRRRHPSWTRPECLSRGVNHGKSKLTDEAVRDIRSSPRRTRLLMAKYGVSKSTIKSVRRGETWRHVA